MAVFPKLQATFRRTTTGNTDNSVAMNTAEENEKHPATDHTTASNGDEEPQPEHPNEDIQRGVQDVEAVTLTWSKTTLVAVFLKYVFVMAADRPLCVSS